MNHNSVSSSHRSEGNVDDATHHSPNTSFQEAPPVRNGKDAHENGSDTTSQHSSDEEYEGSEHSESVWLSRAQSRVEELRKLFNLPPSEVTQAFLGVHNLEQTALYPFLWRHPLA